MKKNIRVRGIHWEKRPVTHTPSYLVRVRKYSRKQVSRTVLWVLWRTGAITYEFLSTQPKIQSHMLPWPVSR